MGEKILSVIRNLRKLYLKKIDCKYSQYIARKWPRVEQCNQAVIEQIRVIELSEIFARKRDLNSQNSNLHLNNLDPQTLNPTIRFSLTFSSVIRYPYHRLISSPSLKMTKLTKILIFLIHTGTSSHVSDVTLPSLMVSPISPHHQPFGRKLTSIYVDCGTAGFPVYLDPIKKIARTL